MTSMAGKSTRLAGMTKVSRSTAKVDTLVAGATGLIGRELVGLSRAADESVCALVRRAPAASAGDGGVDWRVVDFASLPALPPARQAYCALGTTLAVAGSQAAFRAVDFDAVVAFARAARKAGCTRMGVVSALGASERSPSFYSRTKGEAETALAGLGFEHLVIARPSLLAGDRRSLGQPQRLGERVALAITSPLGGLIPAAWRPIEAVVVARALRAALADAKPGITVIDSGQLQRLGRGADRDSAGRVGPTLTGKRRVR